MSIFIINIILIYFWGILIRPSLSKKRAVLFSAICAIQMGIIAGIRADLVSKDGLMYHRLFNKVLNYTLNSEIRNFFNYILGKQHRYSDPAFYVFMKLLQVLGCDWHQTVIIMSMITTSLFAYFVQNESKDPCLSTLIYATLFYPFVSIMAMRQGLAIAAALFAGYVHAERRKLRDFIICILIGFFMHKSAIFAIPIWFVQNREFSGKETRYTALFFLMLIPFGGRVLRFFDRQLDFGGDYSGSYIGMRTLIYVIAIGLVWIAAILLHSRVKEEDRPRFDTLLWMLSIGFLCCACAFTNSNALRVGYYYLISMTVIVPVLLKLVDGHIDILVRMAVPICCGYFITYIQPHILGCTQFLPYWKA